MYYNTRTHQFQTENPGWHSTPEGNVSAPDPAILPARAFACPDGCVLIPGTQRPVLADDGVWCEVWDTEPAADYEAQRAAAQDAAAVAAYAARMEELAPVLAAHPDPADVMPGGQFYRLPDPEESKILTLWYVRDNDLVAQQLSSHDAAGRPVNRSVNLRTRICTTFVLAEIVEGLESKAKAKAKVETTVAAANKLRKEVQ